MKKVLFFTLFNILTSVFGQSFLKYYQSDCIVYGLNEIDPYFFNHNFSCIAEKDENILVGGSLYNEEYNKGALSLTELNTSGGVIENHIIYINGLTGFKIPLALDWNNGYVYIAGYTGEPELKNGGAYGFILKYNYSTKMVVWSKLLVNPQVSIFDMKRHPNGNYLICGEVVTPNVGVLYPKGEEAIIYEVNQASGDFSIYNHSSATTDTEASDTYLSMTWFNNVLFTVGRHEFASGDSYYYMRPTLTRTNLSGGALSFHSYIKDLNTYARLYAVDITNAGGNHLIASYGDYNGIDLKQDLFATLVNSTGGLLWQRKIEIDNEEEDGRFNSCISSFEYTDYNWHHYIHGTYSTSDFVTVVKLNSTGSVEWHKVYENIYSTKAFGTTPNSILKKNDQIFVVGWYPAADIFGDKGALLAIDPTGSQPDGCGIDIPTLSLNYSFYSSNDLYDYEYLITNVHSSKSSKPCSLGSESVCE